MQRIKNLIARPRPSKLNRIYNPNKQCSIAEMALAGNMTLSKEEEEYINIITKYLVPVMFSLVVLVGSVGNILVIYVVSKKVIVIKNMFRTFNFLHFFWFGEITLLDLEDYPILFKNILKCNFLEISNSKKV